jgi:hypothetical protein
MDAPVYLVAGHDFLVEERVRAALQTPSLLGGERAVVIEGVNSLDKA